VPAHFSKVIFIFVAGAALLLLSACAQSRLDGAEAVVEQFYASYSEEASLELVQGSAPNSTLLSRQLRLKLQGWPPGSSELDPFTCTALPAGQLEVAARYMNKDMHSFVLQHSPSGQIFTVDLIYNSDEGWLIHQIHCPQTPEGAAYTFFTWYVSQLDPGGFLRRPVRFADIDYRAPGLLTPGLVQRLEAVTPGLDELEYAIDPFFMVRDRSGPVHWFSVEPDYQGSERARLEFFYSWDMPDVRNRLVMVRQGDIWQIDNLGGFMDNTPDSVAVHFFELYLHCLTSRSFQLECYQLQESDALSPALFEQLSEGKARPAYPDLLLSEALPQALRLKETHSNGEGAVIVLNRYYAHRPEPLPLYLTMQDLDGFWRITAIDAEPPGSLRENP
jgi:hypothetical protein